MTEAGLRSDPDGRASGPGWAAKLALQPWFHRFCARMPGLRHIARAEGAALFEVVSGFVRSQALLALVELRVLHRLIDAPAATHTLAALAGVPVDRMAVLLQAGAALKLIRRKGDMWRLTTRGAAFLTVPGLEAMVRHHPVLYRDLADPVAFFKGETVPELASFWPYVFGAGGAADPGLAARYSDLMADSQGLVADDTLHLISFTGITHLMDVGGGTGAFLAAVGRAHPRIRRSLFDLPGADAISLIRVLYDHADQTVAALLQAVRAALPPGGRLIISEPMSGGARPDPATDVYFAVYTMAMQTGRTRSGPEIAAHLHSAGFEAITPAQSLRPYVTSALTARVPA
ncbi:MAG: SAM-dependent methyltransferase [Rhodobacterales bacterium 32-66-7]|nr:MAG: SAM-dependent methyltransferase [Rhodobacterales bacterium 32-66-7]